MTLFPAPPAASPVFASGLADYAEADLYDPPPDRFTRPRALGLLAIVDIVAGLTAGASTIVAASMSAAAADPFAAPLLAMVAGLCALLAALCFTAAVGVRQMRPFGRLAQMGAAAVWLLSFPLGTLAGAFVLHYLSQPGVRLLLSGRAPASMSLEERVTVVRDGRGRVLVVILRIVLGVAVIAAIGLAAALAATGLTRARAGGNEASAIGRMRAMASGQAVYSSQQRGAYGTVECLVLPALCQGAEGAEVSTPFLSADMALSERNGYAFRFRLSDDRQRYTYWGQPIEPGATGTRAFCISQEGTVLTYPAQHSGPRSADGCPAGGSRLE